MLTNAESTIRLREWTWPSCQAAGGLFRFSTNERLLFSGFESPYILVLVFDQSLQIQLSAVRREMHDRGAFFLFSSGRSFTLQFFANRDYQVNLICYSPGFTERLVDSPWFETLQTVGTAWYFPRARICTAAMRRALVKITAEPGGDSTEDAWPVGICGDILRDYVSAKGAQFQSAQLLAGELDHFYAERDRLIQLIDRVVSFSALMSAAGIRDRPLFRKRMNQVYGMNIRDFITQARMEKAVDLLADFSLPIKQIAALTGFKNAFYFSRVFTRYHGRSPKSYRAGLS